jgi:hypothetical protein
MSFYLRPVSVLGLALLLGGCAAAPHFPTTAELDQEQADYARVHTPMLNRALECLPTSKPVSPADWPCNVEEFRNRIAAANIEHQANAEHDALEARWQAEDLAARQRRLAEQQSEQVDELQRQVRDLRSSQAETLRNLHGVEDEYGLTP